MTALAPMDDVVHVGTTSNRWRLNRAGIINVYQYENEVLRFGGGRLLLRGVNGSGKSTAMNMLLPFLLTARQGRIDAAGEQSGILKSWMLSGRDDAQPVGYLWIEFERHGGFLVCGCGIKANRQSDSVSTWWFVTSKRPGIDVHLVERGVPLSADALRGALDGDDVFSQDRRRDYRRTIEHRLFGGASIDQHIGLINVVRNPRVGDRIDIDLPAHLVDALPQLSEQALAEAAQPLDDLEEHRRNVTELARTNDSIKGLLEVYRAYCVHELRERVAIARSCLDLLDERRRDETRKRRAAATTAAEVARLDQTIAALDHDIRRLRSEVSALEESPAYRDGQQLDALRDLVTELARQQAEATVRADDRGRRVSAEAEAVKAAAARTRDDLTVLNDALALAAGLADHCRVARRGVDPVALLTVEISGTDLAVPEPVGEQGTSAERDLSAITAALLRRRSDVDDVEERTRSLESSERHLTSAETALGLASAAADAAASRLAERHQQLGSAQRNWRQQTTTWAVGMRDLLTEVSMIAPAIEAMATQESAETDGMSDAYEEIHGRLQAEADALVNHWRDIVASLRSRLVAERAAVAKEEDVVADLARRSEPDPPRLVWQSANAYCLADLIDFASELDDHERIGIEAALEASGLLSARLTEDDSRGAMLANGDLVVFVAGGVSSPLSARLTVTVPDRLNGIVDPRIVTELLGSISCDLSSDAPTVIAADGAFRVGSLAGRHTKERAEFIGTTARRAALERARAEAAELLANARRVVAAGEAEAATAQQWSEVAQRQRLELPSLGGIIRTLAEVAASRSEADRAHDDRVLAERVQAAADVDVMHASNELQRVATTLSLPTDRAGLETVRRDLNELAAGLDRCRSLSAALARSVEGWRGAGQRWRIASDDHRIEHEALAEIGAKHDVQRSRLATIEDSIGVEYAEVLAARDQCAATLDAAERGLPLVRSERDDAVARRADANAAVLAAVEQHRSAEHSCDARRTAMIDVIALPGFLDAATFDHSPEAAPGATTIVVSAAGADGLREIIDAVEVLIPDGPADPVTADGVRQSLMRRRDSLGAGWDAEARQPDPAAPLTVEVTGPSGKASLPASTRAVALQHQQLAGLLNRKQDDALRELLQGLIAREVAMKVHGAGRLIELMNQRLSTVTTAHQVGVRLRWRRSPELDAATARMADLLAVVPDLRSDDDERELRQLLSDRLDEARRMNPHLPYRQLIADTLDYRPWHDLSVMLRRGGSNETRLGRNTPLSEGEKKLVTYLPLFAAVAASYDALTEYNVAPGTTAPGIARFVLLDDAFAKVSEDNHASLFGLLVDLDLDLIATSERLWGTHSTVPELAITEVIRDASLGVILLEHYRWDGATLERRGRS